MDEHGAQAPVMDREQLKQAVQEALTALGLLPPTLTPADLQASVQLTPREDGLAPKVIALDAIVHKLTMMRDRLRQVEQRINAADGVGAAERLALQAAVTEAAVALAGISALVRPGAEDTAP